MDYSKILSQKVQEIKPSGIRKFFSIAAEMDDVISLSVGEPDFKTPWSIRQKGIRSLEKGKTFYTANAGLEKLRVDVYKRQGPSCFFAVPAWRLIDVVCNCIFTKQHRDAPNTSNGNQGINDATDDSSRAAEEPSNDVKLK